MLWRGKQTIWRAKDEKDKEICVQTHSFISSHPPLALLLWRHLSAVLFWSRSLGYFSAATPRGQQGGNTLGIRRGKDKIRKWWCIVVKVTMLFLRHSKLSLCARIVACCCVHSMLLGHSFLRRSMNILFLASSNWFCYYILCHCVTTTRHFMRTHVKTQEAKGSSSAPPRQNLRHIIIIIQHHTGW